MKVSKITKKDGLFILSVGGGDKKHKVSENIIEAITSNPVYLAIAVVLAIVIVYGFVKKIIKLALVTVSVFILYVAYLHYTGKNTAEISKQVSKSAEILKDAVSKTGEKVKDSAIKSIEKKVEEELSN